MMSKQFLLALLIAYAEARFGQEQVPIDAIAQVQGGDAGAAATIAGAAISDLLGGADACAKLATADKIVAELGGGADAIAAAIGMVTAEKNTNPFANGNAQVVCGDPTLPATAELRGITTLIDPDVDVDGAAAALSQQTAGAPLAADGLSVFDLMVEAGLGDIIVSSEGGAAAGGNANAGAAAGGNNANAGAGNEAAQGNQNQNANNNDNEEAAQAEEEECEDDAQQGNDANQGNNQNANQGNNQNANQNQNNNQNANEEAGAGAGNAEAGAGAGAGAGGADFGLCTPTIIFEAGANGRAADEFTFQIADELARGGQQEALNPDIITNALCNQLTNVCEANDAAVAVCEDAAAQVAGGTRNKALADTFNELVGFPGAVTNPSGGPADVTDLKRRNVMRSRVFRA